MLSSIMLVVLGYKQNNLVVAYRLDRGFFYTIPREGIDGLNGIPVRMPPRTVSEL